MLFPSHSFSELEFESAFSSAGLSPGRHCTARQTLRLDGEWRFRLDPQNRGKSEQWQRGITESMPITIGRPWEYWHPGYDGVAWYQKEVIVPHAWSHERLSLRFDAVSYYCECWINGEFAGSHEGAFTSFEFDIGAFCHFGTKNFITVRVINPPNDYEIEGFRSGAPLNQSDIPIGKLAWYYNFGGIWQDAWLVCRPRLSLDTLGVFPDRARGCIRTDVEVTNLDGPVQIPLILEISDPEDGRSLIQVEQSLVAESGRSRHSYQLPLDGLQDWSSDNPTLYSLRAEIDGDRLEQRFGVRDFNISGNRFTLNGDPIFLNGFLHQGCYPRTLALPETRALAWRELLQMKKRGFNFLRIAMKPAPHWYLEMTDRLGILVMHEPPIGWIANGPHTRARCLREARDLARRDANHPSVVIQGLFNESFHLSGFMPEQVLQLTSEMAREIRAIDPSRLIIDTSGGFSRRVLSGPDTMIHDSFADGCKISRALPPWKSDFVEIVDVHKYCPFPATTSDIESYRDLAEPGYLIFLAEYGAPETPPDYAEVLRRYRPEEARRGLEDWTLHQQFSASLEQQFERSGLRNEIPSMEAFIAGINHMNAEDCRLIAHAIRTNPNVTGMCFCQLADASGELFGVTDIWRRPKPIYDALASASANPAIGVHLRNRVLWEGEKLNFRASVTADPGIKYAGEVEIVLVSPMGEALWTFRVSLHPHSGIAEIWNAPVDVDLKPGIGSIRALFTDPSGRLNEHVTRFNVLPRLPHREGLLALRDVDGRLENHIRLTGRSIDTFGNNYRNKNVPILLHVEAIPRNRGFYRELYGQLSKIVRLGGCAILFSPETHALYPWLLPSHIRPQAVMRTCPYTITHPVFQNLPCGGAADAFFAEVFPKKWDRSEDILQAGGEVMFGAFSMHMWTRPAEYFWGAGLYRLPLGRGNLLICHLPLVEKLANSPVAAHLLNNLVDYASSLIRKGGEKHLQARCIDPLPPNALTDL